MAKATASATEFLNAIAGKTIEFEVEGVAVELRSLEYAEAEELYAKYGDKPVEMTFHAARLGIAKPVLTEEQTAQLHKALPGAIQKISNKVLEISGMAAQEDGRPLAGSGSPS